MQQHRTFCESRVSFETEVSQQWSIERFAVLKFITTAKDGGRDLCQFWFSVWVSDLDLRRDQIENANFVHLTLFVIYWKMCTNSISGHHLQMAQGVARIDRTTPLSSFRKPKTKKLQIPLTAKPKILNPIGRCTLTLYSFFVEVCEFHDLLSITVWYFIPYTQKIRLLHHRRFVARTKDSSWN